MDIDEITRQFSIVSSSLSSNDMPELNKAIEFTREFQKTPQFFKWIILTYPQMNDENVVKQQLIAIRNLYTQNESPFTEFHDDIRNLLFTQGKHERFSQNQQCMNILAYAQVAFMWKTFPDEWENFWTDLFNSFRDDFILEFLYAFSAYASILNGNDNYLYTRIKDKMRENGSDAAITQFTIFHMSNGNIKAFYIFHYLCEWVNIDYLLGHDKPSIEIINGFIQNPDYSVICLEILSQLVSRGMMDSIKGQILNDFNLIGTLQMIIGSSPNDSIAASAANLVNSAGEFYLKEHRHAPFVELALMFLSHGNCSVSSAVFPFLKLVCKMDPQLSPQADILSQSINRMIVFFQGESDDPGYMDQITELCSAAINASPVENYGRLVEMFEMCKMQNVEQGIVSIVNTPLASSIIHVVCYSLSDGKKQKYIETFIGIFKIILSMPPLDSFISCAIYDFIKFTITISSEINQKETILEIFDRICSYCFEKFQGINIPEEFNNDIASLLYHFVERVYYRIQFNPQVIFNFVQMSNKYLASAAAILIRSFDKKIQPEYANKCLEMLNAQFCNVSSVEQLEVILSFLKCLQYLPGSPHIGTAKEILINILNGCKDNFDDSLFELFIKAAFYSLCNDSLDIIDRCLSFINIGPKSLTAFCNVARSMLIRPEIPNGPWVESFLDILLPIIITKFNEVQEYISTFGKTESEEINETITITCQFINFYSYAIRLAPQFVQKSYNVMVNLITIILKDHFDIPILDEKIIDLLCDMEAIDPNSIFQGLGILAVKFLYTSKFNPSTEPWFKVCKRLVAFHSYFLQKYGEQTKEMIQNSFKLFVKNEEQFNHFYQSYMTILNINRVQTQIEESKTFFIDFAKFLSQNN